MDILDELFTGTVTPQAVVLAVKKSRGNSVKDDQSITNDTTRQYQEFVPFLLNYLRDQTLHLSTHLISPAKTPVSAQKVRKSTPRTTTKTNDKKCKQLFSASPGDCLEETYSTQESVFSPNVSFDSPGVVRKGSTTPLSVEHRKYEGNVREKGHRNAGHHSSPHNYHSPSSDRSRHRLSLGEFMVSPDVDDNQNFKRKPSPFLSNRRDDNNSRHSSSRSTQNHTVSPAPVFSLHSISDFPPMDQQIRKSDVDEKGKNMHSLTQMKDSPNFEMTPKHSKPNVITKSRRISFTTLQPDISPSPPCKAPSRRIKPTPVQPNTVRPQNKAFLDTGHNKTEPVQAPVAFSETNDVDVQIKNCLLQERELLRQERAKRLLDMPCSASPVTPTKALERSNSVVEAADPSQVTYKDKLDILAGVYTLCLQDNLLPNLAVELYFLLQLLTARSVDMELVSSYDTSDNNYFCSIHNTVYFSVCVLTKQTSFLKMLDRSTLRLMSENHRINVFSESLGGWLRTELAQGHNQIGPAFPKSPIGGVSFQAETDNRQNFPNDSSFHLFKKQRDSFYELLREWEANHMNPSWSFVNSLGDRIQSLVSCRAELANHLHFARLFQSQLITMCKGDGNIQIDGEEENIALLRQLKLSNPEKFKRLQERFIMPLSIGGPCPPPWFPGCQEFFRDFISAANSPVFNQHLIDTFTARITELNELMFTKVELEETEVSDDSDDEEKGRFVSNLMTLRLLAKFLGYVVFLPYQSTSKIPEEMEVMYRSHRRNHCLPIDVAVCLRDGYSHGHLSLTLPWVVEFLSMMDSFAPKIDVIQFVLFILLFIHRLSWRSVCDINYLELLVTTCISWLFENCVLPEGFFFAEVPEDVSVFMGVTSEQNKTDKLDELGFVDQKLYYGCCPYVGELKRLLVEFAVGFSSKNSTIRKITPVSADDGTKQSMSQRQTQVQLEENFFHNHPTSLKRTVDFVADRTASNYIKRFRALLLQRALSESKTKLAHQLEAMASGSPTGKAKDKLQFVIVQLSKAHVQNVRALSTAEVESYCEKKAAAVLPLLLPDGQSEAVINMASQISLRIAMDKVQQWITKHITPALFQGELQLELDRLMKVAMITEQRMMGGAQQKPFSSLNTDEVVKVIAKTHNTSAPSPSDVLVELKEAVLERDGLHGQQFYKEILQQVKLVICERQDVIPSVYKSYGKLTLDLFLGLMSSPISDQILKEFIDMWKLLKPHASFHGVVCPRTVYQMQKTVKPNEAWQCFTLLLIHLLEEDLLVDKDLQQGCIDLLNSYKKYEDYVIQLGEALLSIVQYFKDKVDLSEAMVLLWEVVGESSPMAERIQVVCPLVNQRISADLENSCLSKISEENEATEVT